MPEVSSQTSLSLDTAKILVGYARSPLASYKHEDNRIAVKSELQRYLELCSSTYGKELTTRTALNPEAIEQADKVIQKMNTSTTIDFANAIPKIDQNKTLQAYRATKVLENYFIAATEPPHSVFGKDRTPEQINREKRVRKCGAQNSVVDYYYGQFLERYDVWKKKTGNAAAPFHWVTGSIAAQLKNEISEFRGHLDATSSTELKIPVTIPAATIFSDTEVTKMQNELDAVMQVHRLFDNDPKIQSFKLRIADGEEDARQGTDIGVLLTMKDGKQTQIRIQTKHMATFANVKEGTFTIATHTNTQKEAVSKPLPPELWGSQLVILDPTNDSKPEQVRLNGSTETTRQLSNKEIQSFVIDTLGEEGEFTSLFRNTVIDHEDHRTLFAKAEPTDYRFAYLFMQKTTGSGTNKR